ncbi:MAG: Rrf2 family transcriptional regulator [Candidatus Omnitrophota bacterium]
MWLTSRISYGVRALINLALMYEKNQPVTIKEIAREEGISSLFLEQIFNCLKRKGLVKSVRGPKGGYALVKNPSDINIYQILEALEGRKVSHRCFAHKEKGQVCKRAAVCASREVWDDVDKQVKVTLEGYSLEHLATRTKEISPDVPGRLM